MPCIAVRSSDGDNRRGGPATIQRTYRDPEAPSTRARSHRTKQSRWRSLSRAVYPCWAHNRLGAEQALGANARSRHALRTSGGLKRRPRTTGEAAYEAVLGRARLHRSEERRVGRERCRVSRFVLPTATIVAVAQQRSSEHTVIQKPPARERDHIGPSSRDGGRSPEQSILAGRTIVWVPSRHWGPTHARAMRYERVGG